jgi:beta-N-acetylhexosaminidase
MHEFTGGEFIVMGVPGERLDDETAAIIKSVQPAGFILFARNIKSPEQLRGLTDELRAAVNHEPIITIDQEGGRVSRLKEFMAEPPSARQLAMHGDKSLVEKHGRITGKLLRLFGFNLNLAPVLDIEVDDENDNSLKGRTYGRSIEEVVANASAFATAMGKEGILCCGKHFPGYSSASVDPHHAMPIVNRTFDQMMELEWLPFRRCVPMLDTMMLGHVSYPLIDSSGLPATLSPYMVQNILRDELAFSGCTITDDMDMGAIKETYGSAEAASRALKAGNDLMLVCHNIKGVAEIASALRAVSKDVQIAAYDRISAMRKRLAPPVPFSLEALKTLDQAVKELRDQTLLEADRKLAEAPRK